MAMQKRKTRMYEPWGYQDENNYKSTEILVENDFDAFLVDTSYNKDDNKIYFTNKDGETKASLDVSEFVKSDSIIEKTEYKDGILKITFTNGDVITIDLTELLDENEFGNGLQVADHVVSVLADASSDDYLSVSENGVKVAGVKADIEAEQARAESEEQRIEAKLDAETARATSAETALDAKIDQEIADRTVDVDAEEARATSAETALQTALTNEITRAEAAEESLNRRNDTLNDELDGEKTIREAADVALGRRIDNEIDDRKADVDAEETRAEEAETALQAAIEAEGQRAQDAESALTEAINVEEARAMSAETDLNAAIELKSDADTVYTKEEVDELLGEKEAEIAAIKKNYNDLKNIVGELGGDVKWNVPSDGEFKDLMKKNGTVTLSEDTTSSTFTGGITSKNKTILNLNSKTLTFTGNTTNNLGIMTRGKEEITIMGKGTLDANGCIAVEANGTGSTINLSGTTGMFGSQPTYVTDRSGGELIYCYSGTINISAGVFKNLGENKKFLLNCYDANYQNGTAKIIVTGGSFYDFNPADNSAEGEHTSFVPEGYHVEISTDGDSTVYTVKKDT